MTSRKETLTLSVREVAAALGISRMSAYQGVARGEIPALRVGKRLLIPKAALDNLLAQGGSRSEAASGR